MQDVTRDNFGLLIAYLLPGFTCLWGIALNSEAVRQWLLATQPEAPSVGGFLYATLASIALGLISSTVRWAIIDRTFARFGLCQPDWSLPSFAERLAAFQALVADHYRYYQFYANMLVALVFLYLCHLTSGLFPVYQEAELLLGLVLIESILLLGARDTLWKYYSRTGALLCPPTQTIERQRAQGKAHRPQLGRPANVQLPARLRSQEAILSGTSPAGTRQSEPD